MSLVSCVWSPSNALYLLVCVSQRLVDAVESGAAVSYLDETLKNALICIRRLFDKFIVSHTLTPSHAHTLTPSHPHTDHQEASD